MRRHLSLLVSGGVVLLIGLLGVYAGNAAGAQAREVHRADRSALQSTLAGLVDKYLLLTAAEVADHLQYTALAGDGAWSARPGDPASVVRLTTLVTDTRALDAGAAVLDGSGRVLAAWSPTGQLPAADDPGWRPLYATVAARDGRLPLSGVLDAGGEPVLAMALPVPLDDGTDGLVIGLWRAKDGGLQDYVAGLTYGATGHGYVVDGAGLVVAGPAPRGRLDTVGRPLALRGVLEQIARSPSGLVDTVEDGRAYVTSFARAGGTGWTAVTPQDADEFEGGLRRSSQVVQAAVVALLVIAGIGLVVLHRKREAVLRLVALRDELTGIYNRRGWFAVAEHELERARRTGSVRHLLFVDVDGLKQVNDVLGHREGDAAVRAAAQVLVAASRSSDLVGRLGGDEFVLLLGDGSEAHVVRQRVREALAEYNAASTTGFELRLSLGCEAWHPDEPCSLDELVRRADAVMYVDKHARPLRHEGVLRIPEPLELTTADRSH